MGREIEIKLLCEDMNLLRNVFDLPLIRPYLETNPSTAVLKTSYIDTASLDLSAHGFAFRNRLEGNRWKAAIKRGKSYDAGLYVRDEWEVDIPYPTMDLEIFEDAALAEALKSLVGGKRLIVLFEVLVDRTGALLRFEDGTEIDAVIDEGKIRSYGLEEPVLELEIELKSGSRDRLVALGESLKETYAMREGKESKYARGLALFKKAMATGDVGAFLEDVEGISEH